MVLIPNNHKGTRQQNRTLANLNNLGERIIESGRKAKSEWFPCRPVVQFSKGRSKITKYDPVANNRIKVKKAVSLVLFI
jgi:hypothetical protein